MALNFIQGNFFLVINLIHKNFRISKYGFLKAIFGFLYCFLILFNFCSIILNFQSIKFEISFKFYFSIFFYYIQFLFIKKKYGIELL